MKVKKIKFLSLAVSGLLLMPYVQNIAFASSLDDETQSASPLQMCDEDFGWFWQNQFLSREVQPLMPAETHCEGSGWFNPNSITDSETYHSLSPVQMYDGNFRYPWQSSTAGNFNPILMTPLETYYDEGSEWFNPNSITDDEEPIISLPKTSRVCFDLPIFERYLDPQPVTVESRDERAQDLNLQLTSGNGSLTPSTRQVNDEGLEFDVNFDLKVEMNGSQSLDFFITYAESENATLDNKIEALKIIFLVTGRGNIHDFDTIAKDEYGMRALIAYSKLRFESFDMRQNMLEAVFKAKGVKCYNDYKLLAENKQGLEILISYANIPTVLFERRKAALKAIFDKIGTSYDAIFQNKLGIDALIVYGGTEKFNYNDRKEALERLFKAMCAGGDIDYDLIAQSEQGREAILAYLNNTKADFITRKKAAIAVKSAIGKKDGCINLQRLIQNEQGLNALLIYAKMFPRSKEEARDIYKNIFKFLGNGDETNYELISKRSSGLRALYFYLKSNLASLDEKIKIINLMYWMHDASFYRRRVTEMAFKMMREKRLTEEQKQILSLIVFN